MCKLRRVICGVVLGAVVVDCATAHTGSHGMRHSLPDTVARTWMREHAPETRDWNWRDGVLVYGLWRMHERTREPTYADYVRDYMAHHLATGISVRWSDHTTPALTAAELVLAGEARFRPLVDRVVRYIMQAPRTAQQGLIRHTADRVPSWLLPGWLPDIWVDSLFHIVPTLMRYSEITRSPRYAGEAVQQLQGFARNLQDPETHLFTHAYNDWPRNQPVPSFDRRAFWARGNGWILVTLVDVLSRLPQNHPVRPELSQRLARQVKALLRVQSSEGLFHTLLLDPASYLETAGSALIAYGLAEGARHGLLDAEAQVAAEHAMRGLQSIVTRQGDRALVTGTSLGTNPIAFRYRRIRRRSQVSYGVGAWLMAASTPAWDRAMTGSLPRQGAGATSPLRAKRGAAQHAATYANEP